MVYTYDYATGNLISVQDGKGNELEYGYDALERMNLLKGSAGSAVNKNELTYSGSDITVMKHSGAQYNIAYDNKKHIETFKVGTSNYITTENAQYKTHGEFLTYNYSGSNVTQYADKYGRTVKEVWSDGGQRCYCYGTESESMSGVTASNFENRDINSAGKLRKVIDGSRNIVYTYTDGEIDGIEYSDGNEYGVERDQYGRIMTETIKAGGTTYSVTYMYQDGDAYNGDRLTTYLVSAGGKVCISGLTYDELGRIVSQSKGTLSGSAGNTVTQEQYAYGNADVTQVSKITYGDGATSTYSYDACGNITQVSGKETVKYSYDGLNRLVREDNAALNKSYTYSYDAGGNITAKKEYAYTTGTLGAAVKTYNYVYGSNSWKDKLTSWNGQSITYDSYGNVKSYKGATYTWDRLNRLKSCVKSNGTTEYTYNVDGQPEKTELDYGNGMVGTTEREYVNGRLYKESKILTMNGAEIVSATMQYLYRGEEVIGLIYNGDLYYYRKNLQGDIIEIVDEDGNVAATYKYDAWGNWTVSGGDVGTYNSFRYRGYYYDTAIMLYYLKTRWYDPETGRFISPDSINYLDPQSINGLNLYAYCLNNPVMYTDPEGKSILQFFISLVSYVGMAIMSIWDDDIRNDMDAIGWNPFNTNESAVVQSSKVSFYKGVPVIRTNMNRSGTFYAIFLQSNANIVTLKHEWGHTIQSAILGPIKYGVMIGLPSAFEWSNRSYYSRPWEITADIFGGVSERLDSNYYNQNDIIRGFAYLGVSAYFGIVSYFFLIGELG